MDSRNYTEEIYTLLKCGCYQRTLHYHNTPKVYDRLYNAQIEYIVKNYEVYGIEDIEKKVMGYKKDLKPSIVIGAFDGYRNNYDVLHRILIKHNLKAWFLLVTDFINTPIIEQEGKLHLYNMQYMLDEYSDKRYAMSWEEAKEIADKHVIVNHSATHFRLDAESKYDNIIYEIEQSHKLIFDHIEVEPIVFSWLGGGDCTTNASALKTLLKNNYEYLIGYRFEKIGMGNKEFPWKIEDYNGCEISDKILNDEIVYHEQVMKNIGIFSAVPAILPLYQAGKSIAYVGNDQDRMLADHYYHLSNKIFKNRRISDRDAAFQALDVLAMNMLGKEFPYHLNEIE